MPFSHETEPRFQRALGSGVWGGLNRILLGVVLSALCLWVVLLLAPVAKSDQELDRRIQEKREQIAREETLLKQIRRKEELLKRDPSFEETVARDQLDVMKPGETILRIETAGKP